MKKHASLLAFGVAWLAVSSPARASDAEVFGAGAERVDLAELDDQRGGFSWQGVDVQLGAELRSYVSDNLVVQTNISWADAQPSVQRMVSDGVTPISPADLQGVLGGDIGTQLGLGSAYLTNDGQTAFIQRADMGLQNIIVNTANNVAIRQELDATIDLGNFAAFQSGMLSDRMGMTLGSLIGLAGIGR